MLQSNWHLLGGLAVLATGSILLTDIDEIIAGAAGTILWAGFALGATNIVKPQGVCCTYTTSSPLLAVFGGAMAAIMLAVALYGTVVMVAPGSVPVAGATSTSAEDSNG